MIEEKKEKINPVVKLLLFLFIAFLIMYLSKETGYYEYKTYTKTRLTEEAIKRFESDVNEGKNVSINDYLVDEYIDYSNIFTKTGSTINKTIELVMNDGIKKTLKILSELFYE